LQKRFSPAGFEKLVMNMVDLEGKCSDLIVSLINKKHAQVILLLLRVYFEHVLADRS